MKVRLRKRPAKILEGYLEPDERGSRARIDDRGLSARQLDPNPTSVYS